MCVMMMTAMTLVIMVTMQDDFSCSSQVSISVNQLQLIYQLNCHSVTHSSQQPSFIHFLCLNTPSIQDLLVFCEDKGRLLQLMYLTSVTVHSWDTQVRFQSTNQLIS